MRRVRNYFFYICFLVVVALIAIPKVDLSVKDSSTVSSDSVPSDSSGTILPAVGVWNGFNNHKVVIECLNSSSKDLDLLVSISDSSNKELGSEPLSLPKYSSKHLLLNKYPIENTYGTFEVSKASSSIKEEEVSISCFTVTYLMDGLQSVGYATTIPLTNPKNGKTSGVYNSINPDININRPVYNWLSIYNPSKTSFGASLNVRDSDGQIRADKSVRVESLLPGERRDFPLGHDTGQVVGIYEIIPDDPVSDYGAFLSRYSEVSANKFNFSMTIPSSSGYHDSGLIPASTMGPANNWGEVANISDSSATANIEIFDRDGKLISSETKEIPPYSQYHIFLNKLIGELNVGFFRVKSNTKILAQSFYYGQDHVNLRSIGWAYNASGGKGRSLRKASFPVNTFLSAPNWLKVLNKDSKKPINLELSIYDSTGSQISLGGDSNITVYGTKDIAVHEIIGPDFIGIVKLNLLEEDQSFQAQLIRVYVGGSLSSGRAMESRSMREISNQKRSSSSGIESISVFDPIIDGGNSEEEEEPEEEPGAGTTPTPVASQSASPAVSSSASPAVSQSSSPLASASSVASASSSSISSPSASPQVSRSAAATNSARPSVSTSSSSSPSRSRSPSPSASVSASVSRSASASPSASATPAPNTDFLPFTEADCGDLHSWKVGYPTLYPNARDLPRYVDPPAGKVCCIAGTKYHSPIFSQNGYEYNISPVIAALPYGFRYGHSTTADECCAKSSLDWSSRNGGKTFKLEGNPNSTFSRALNRELYVISRHSNGVSPAVKIENESFRCCNTNPNLSKTTSETLTNIKHIAMEQGYRNPSTSADGYNGNIRSDSYYSGGPGTKRCLPACSKNTQNETIPGSNYTGPGAQDGGGACCRVSCNGDDRLDFHQVGIRGGSTCTPTDGSPNGNAKGICVPCPECEINKLASAAGCMADEPSANIINRSLGINTEACTYRPPTCSTIR